MAQRELRHLARRVPHQRQRQEGGLSLTTTAEKLPGIPDELQHIYQEAHQRLEQDDGKDLLPVAERIFRSMAQRRIVLDIHGEPVPFRWPSEEDSEKTRALFQQADTATRAALEASIKDQPTAEHQAAAESVARDMRAHASSLCLESSMRMELLRDRDGATELAVGILQGLAGEVMRARATAGTFRRHEPGKSTRAAAQSARPHAEPVGRS